MDKPLKIEDFSENVGAAYEIGLGEGKALKATLAECTAVGKATEHRQPFNLLFKGPGRAALPQQIYQVRTPDGEEHEIFLVTLYSDGEESQYEAVFF